MYSLKTRRQLRGWGQTKAIPISNRVVEKQDGYSETVMPESTWHELRQGLFKKNWQILTREFRKHYNQCVKNGIPYYTITGSEAAAAVDASQFKSAKQLWDEKKQVYTEDPSERNTKADIFWRGHMAESHVMKLAQYVLEQEYGEENYYIWTDKRLFVCRNPEKSFMLYDPDGFALVRNSPDDEWKFLVVECKTVASFRYEAQAAWTAGFVPDSYVLQGRHGMEVMDADGLLLICAWGFEVNEYAFKFIDRYTLVPNCPMDMLGEDLAQKEREFLQRVTDGTEPEHSTEFPVVENSYWGKVTRPKQPRVDISEDYAEEIHRMAEIKAELDTMEEHENALKEELASLENILYPVMADAEIGIYKDSDGKVYKISAKPTYGRKSIDIEGLKQDYPKEYAEMLDSERLTATLKPHKKKKYASLVDAYTIPGQPKGERKWSITVIEK